MNGWVYANKNLQKCALEISAYVQKNCALLALLVFVQKLFERPIEDLFVKKMIFQICIQVRFYVTLENRDLSRIKFPTLLNLLVQKVYFYLK